MSATRLQLSLYADAAEAVSIEAARRLLDPVQLGLIPAHVTLCREDELGELPALLERLSRLDEPLLRLRFGAPQPFLGAGWLLPCIAGEEAFVGLRHRVLGRAKVREQLPHITLAHPRNPPPSVDAIARAWLLLKQDLTLQFRIVRLIEQKGRAPWTVLDEFKICRE